MSSVGAAARNPRGPVPESSGPGAGSRAGPSGTVTPLPAPPGRGFEIFLGHGSDSGCPPLLGASEKLGRDPQEPQWLSCPWLCLPVLLLPVCILQAHSDVR